MNLSVLLAELPELFDQSLRAMVDSGSVSILQASLILSY